MTKTLIERLTWATAEQQKKGLALINGRVSPDIYTSVKRLLKQSYLLRYDERVMIALNEVLECHGVETVLVGGDRGYFDYLNTGDMYTATVVYRNDLRKRWDITDIGTLIEMYERRGYKTS